jgi:hypothetical protein
MAAKVTRVGITRRTDVDFVSGSAVRGTGDGGVSLAGNYDSRL